MQPLLGNGRETTRDWTTNRSRGTVFSMIPNDREVRQFFFNLNPGQPRTLLQLKLVGILTINLFLT
jgi:hypothetical protein